MLMRTLRLGARLGLFAIVLLLCSLLAVAVSLTEWTIRRPIDRTPFARACFRLASRCLGFQVNVRGQRPDGPVMLVCNHISWSDIPILGSIVPLRFLSKAEVRNWPVIGWLAKQAGTLFIRRGSGQAAVAREDIARTLRERQSVLVFPEGTTSVGITVLPFHGRLLSAAAEAGVPILPMTIGYRRDNHPDPLAPFIGDDSFDRHLVRLLKQPAVTVDVVLHEPVSVAANDDFQALARQLRATVEDGLQTIHNCPDKPGATPDYPASRPRLGGA
ncbi:lysophospholipid acyltransferase family protein [Marinobacter sp. JSM 1782161]|uniref:lysophospholipid acyltransferase family protein n=1 Tax=Marinobacter sp. JSM 1782161 TaxID=2685906 RepID=UPI001401F817|nr:lysophospholipid acyltransferase family protein [Marinobacter sp. JSM 1782161]